jgi:sugar phosphate isomerase/epimerase
LTVNLAECSLNSITAKRADLWTLLELARAHGFGGVGLWRDLLDDVDLTTAANRIADAGLRVSSVCRGGMFVEPDARTRRGRFDDNRAAVDQAHALNAECLVLVCGTAPDDLSGARAQVREGIAELMPYARQAGIRLAVEPFHPMLAASRSVITSLTETNDLLDALGGELGIAIDAYHVWWDAALDGQISRAGSAIYAVQLADWVTPINDELTSRGMPGEGCIDLRGFVDACRAVGYQRLIEVEVLSDRWWAQPATTAVETAAAALAKL